MQFNFLLPRQRLFVLWKLFLLYLIFSTQTLSAGDIYKANTIIAFQWWKPGTFFITLDAADEETGMKTEGYSPEVLVLLMVVAPDSYGKGAQFSAILPGDDKEELDDGVKKKTLKVTLTTETGHIHLVSNRKFNITPRVYGNPPEAGFVYNQKNDTEYAPSYRHLHVSSPYGVLKYSKEKWLSMSMENTEAFFIKYDELVFGVDAGSKLDVYEFDSDRGAVTQIAENTEATQWLSSWSTETGSDELDMEALDKIVKSLSVSDPPRNVDVDKAVLEKIEESFFVIGSPGKAGDETEKKVAGEGVGFTITKQVAEKIKNEFDKLEKKSNLFNATPERLLQDMKTLYGNTSISFVSALENLGFHFNGKEEPTVPLFHFLVCARIAGVTTIDGLPGLYEAGVYKKDVMDFFENPEYQTWEEVPEVNAGAGAEAVGELDGAAQALYKVLQGRGKKKAESGRHTFNYDAELVNFLESALPEVCFELHDEVNVGATWLTRRVSIVEDQGEGIQGEIRIYMTPDEYIDKFKMALDIAGELSKYAGHDIIHNPFLNYIGGGINVQIVFPDYVHGKNEVETLYSLVKKRRLSHDETLYYIEKIMELLACLHGENIIVNYLAPSQLVPVCKKNIGVMLLEVKPGLERLSSEVDSVPFIQRDIFQALKIYYSLMTGCDLESKFHEIRDMDYRFQELASLQSVFFGDPEGFRDIWNTWLSVSGSNSSTVEYDVVKLFATENRGMDSAEKVLAGIRLLKQKKYTEMMGNEGYQEPIETESINLKKYRTWNLKCRKGHVLHMEEVTKIAKRYKTSVECNKCYGYTGRHQALCSGEVMHCSECKYDLCGPCTVDKMRLFALPSGVRCPQNHSMSFSPPESRKVKCQRCNASFQSHHYSCPACSGSSGSYCLCPQCALTETIKNATVMSPQKQQPMSYKKVSAEDGLHCQHCKIRWGSQGEAFVYDADDVLCRECAASELQWFGPPSTHFTKPSPKRYH